MNTDLYQALTVALLGAITVLLIVVIANLGRLRKVLESTRTISHDLPAQPAATDSAMTSSPAATQEESRPAGTSEAQEGRADVGQEEEREPVGARSVFTRPEESGEAAGSAAGADTQRVEAVEQQTSPEEEPQEQPFERDGRWWFRRGDELLVYDEQTGQWLQVAGPPAGHAGSAPASEASGAVVTETRTITETTTAGDQAESASSARSFWKCASCGAINGAAATSCRMCFAARP